MILLSIVFRETNYFGCYPAGWLSVLNAMEWYGRYEAGVPSIVVVGLPTGALVCACCYHVCGAAGPGKDSHEELRG